MKCELCGATIHGKPHVVEVDGAILRVCDKCARFGKKVVRRQQTIRKTPVISTRRATLDEDLILTEDYHLLIKKAREALGLTQEELGRKLGEKTSVISKLETGKLKPSIPLAKKIEHVLKIKILEKISE